jgi:hypothetical protein
MSDKLGREKLKKIMPLGGGPKSIKFVKKRPRKWKIAI